MQQEYSNSEFCRRKLWSQGATCKEISEGEVQRKEGNARVLVQRPPRSELVGRTWKGEEQDWSLRDSPDKVRMTRSSQRSFGDDIALLSARLRT